MNNIWIKTILSTILFFVLFIAFQFTMYSKFGKLDEFSFGTIFKDGGVIIVTFFAMKIYEIFKNRNNKK